jgi:hypothetical protein
MRSSVPVKTTVLPATAEPAAEGAAASSMSSLVRRAPRAAGRTIGGFPLSCCFSLDPELVVEEHRNTVNRGRLLTRLGCSRIVRNQGENRNHAWRARMDNFDPTKPNIFPDLTPRIEKGTPPMRGIEPYRADYYVECAFCASHQKHRRGWLVQTEDGRLALLGIDCAEDHLGEEMVRELRRDLVKFERQLENGRQLADLLIGVDDVLGEIARWTPTEAAIDEAVSAMTFAWGRLREYGSTEPFAGYPELGSARSPLLAGASKLTAIRRAREQTRIRPADLIQLEKGKSTAIVSLEHFIRRCRAAQRFFSQSQIATFNENYVQDPAWIEWDNSPGAHAVAIDFGRGPTMRIAAPNLSKLPRYEDLVAPLLGGKSIAAE